MSDLRKAAEMALDYIRREGWTSPQGKEVWLALRQALSQPEQYDQTALELCEKCGWKAIIPDEGCLICTTPVSIEKQEPIGYVTDSGASAYFLKGVNLDDDTPLYAAPPKREWKGLTSDDKHFLLANAWNKEQAFDGFMEAIDKFLEGKNT